MASSKALSMLCIVHFLIVTALCHREKDVLSVKKVGFSSEISESSSPLQQSMMKSGAAVLEMRHKDYYSGIILDMNERFKKHLQADVTRVESIQARIRSRRKPDSQAQIPLISGFNLHTLNYVVQTTLGGRNLTVIIDTGSDLTWVQCQPCTSCYTQPEPLFDPKMSSSYHSIPCRSSLCRSLQFATGNSGLCAISSATCNYAVSYGDGSFSRGELASEKLILGTTTFDKFVFGCGKNNRGLFGSASGLMGFGRSDLSTISQTSDAFNGVFSYCLPTTEPGSSGSLVLGKADSNSFKNSTPFSYTKMVSNPQLPTFYILNLTGIGVGGISVQSPSFGTSGILIDSGTVITRLPPSIYRAVKGEFLKQFSGYPTAPGFSLLDTCFNLTGYDEVDVPTIKMEFDGGAELTVDVAGTFYVAKNDGSQVCLALASLTYEDEVGIIGNFQQRNTRVVYDTKLGYLGFAKENCSFSG